MAVGVLSEMFVSQPRDVVSPLKDEVNAGLKLYMNNLAENQTSEEY